VGCVAVKDEGIAIDSAATLLRIAPVEERTNPDVLLDFTLPFAMDEECELGIEHQIWDLAELRRVVRLTLVTLSEIHAKTCQLLGSRQKSAPQPGGWSAVSPFERESGSPARFELPPQLVADSRRRLARWRLR
jgi:hypothetical protein